MWKSNNNSPKIFPSSEQLWLIIMIISLIIILCFAGLSWSPSLLKLVWFRYLKVPKPAEHHQIELLKPGYNHYASGRRFYVTLNACILSVHVFLRNWTHDLVVANAMYCLSYRDDIKSACAEAVVFSRGVFM